MDIYLASARIISASAQHKIKAQQRKTVTLLSPPEDDGTE
jgi:hypothetical protein